MTVLFVTGARLNAVKASLWNIGLKVDVFIGNIAQL